MDIFEKLQMEMGLKNIMPEYEMVSEIIATQMYAYFKALVNAGFTEEQALELVKEHGANIGKLM